MRFARPLLLVLAVVTLSSVEPSSPLAPRACAAAEPRAAVDSASADPLAATSAPPWTPERPVGDGEPWETALRLPGRVATLPLSALGAATRAGLLHVEQSFVVPKTLFFFLAPLQAGIRIEPASLGDRTGFGLAVGYSPPAFGRLVTAEWSGSTMKYTRARVRAGRPQLYAEYVSNWRSSDEFYGLGPAAAPEEDSRFASKEERGTIAGRVPLARGEHAWRPSLEAWAGLRRMRELPGRELGDDPSIEARFPDRARDLDVAVSHAFGGARLELDGRAGAPHWSRGARVALAAERFEARDAEGARDAASFTRTTLDAEAGASFRRDPRTLRLRVRATHLAGADTGAVLLLGDHALLGGSAGLEGFDPYRYRDRDAVLARLTYLFPLAQHFEMDLHAEWGSVMDDLFSDARLDRLEHSFGVALRPRTTVAPLGALGVDWSREAVRFSFSIGGVE